MIEADEERSRVREEEERLQQEDAQQQPPPAANPYMMPGPPHNQFPPTAPGKLRWKGAAMKTKSNFKAFPMSHLTTCDYYSLQLEKNT